MFLQNFIMVFGVVSATKKDVIEFIDDPYNSEFKENYAKIENFNAESVEKLKSITLCIRYR